MTIRADYDPKYFRRFLWIALGCLAFALWCFYDALVKYPGELKRAEAYWSPDETVPGKFRALDRNSWETLARENNWSVDPPDMPDALAHKITSQYFYALVCGLVGVPCLLKWLLARGSWVEANGEMVRTSWGPEFRFDEVRKIDKTKWEKKGIARIEYESGERSRQFVFDDFKFQRKPMGRILYNLEQSLEDSQITGAPRERDPDAPAEVAAPAESEHGDGD